MIDIEERVRFVIDQQFNEKEESPFVQEAEDDIEAPETAVSTDPTAPVSTDPEEPKEFRRRKFVAPKNKRKLANKRLRKNLKYCFRI